MRRLFVAMMVMLVASLLLLAQPHLEPASAQIQSVTETGTVPQQDEILISNDQFVFHPNFYSFDIQGFLQSQPGVLKDYNVEIHGELVSAADIIESTAYFYSINPQVLLALLETKSSLLSDPHLSHSRVEMAMGINELGMDDFASQLNYVAGRMFRILYRNAQENSKGITTLDATAATLTLMSAFSQTSQQTTTSEEFARSQPQRFVEVFTEWFGDPLSKRVSAPSRDSSAPQFHYPWPAGGFAEGWKKVRGPHDNFGWPLADEKTEEGGNYPKGLDFVPPHAVNVATGSPNNPCIGRNDDPDHRAECAEANRGIARQYWAIASAPGNVVYSGFSQVVVQHNSEWGTLYYHIATEGRVPEGPLPADLHVGHPSSECNQGGYSTTSHVHFSILYGGVFQTAREFVDITLYEHSLTEWGGASVSGVTLYEHANFAGESLPLTISDEDLCDNPLDSSQPPVDPCFSAPSWNDVASSIKVMPGYKAILALHSKDWDIDQYGQAQSRLACDADISDFALLSFDGTNIPLNDNVSKVIVAKCAPGSSTQALSAASADDPCQPDIPSTTDNATFTGYETPSNGTAVSPGQSLVKTWQLRNTGSTTWGSGYKLVFRSGDRLGTPESVDVPTVPLKQEVDLSVPLQIPSNLASNTYTGHWQLRDPQGKFFGPDLWVTVKVVSSNPGSGHITVFDISNPSSASVVHLLGRARWFPEYRSMRFVLGIDEQHDPNPLLVGDQREISYDWNTAGLPPGDYTLALEVATNGDPDWVNAERWVRTYTLTGTGSGRPPDRPVLKSPYNWYLKDNGGADAPVQMCVYPTSDPDGDTVQYFFQLLNQIGDPVQNSGWITNTCWEPTLSPAIYSWYAKAGDGTNESDSSQETWNFSVAGGNVTIGDINFFDTNTNNTHICVLVTYEGIIAPEVRGFINGAADGSESGPWYMLDHYGPNTTPDCTNSNEHGFWIRSLYYETGNHVIRINADKRDSGASRTRTTNYNIAYIRPPSPVLLAPSTPDDNGTWWNTLAITFQWNLALRTESQTLRVSTSPGIWNDPSPLVNVSLGASATSHTHTFSQDYGKLYWGVRATNSAGYSDSAGGVWFGIDRVVPTCTVQTLPATTWESVFQVNWSGSDNSALVRSYDIQYLDTGRGEWKDWLLDVPESKTYDTFLGQPGHEYGFRCRTTDKAGNTNNYPAIADTSIRVDPTTRPPTPWWDPAYSGKRNLIIQNNMPSIALPVGYPVHLHFDNTTAPTAAELYNASQSSTKCNDLRMVYNDDPPELDRLVPNCSSSAIDIWFRTQVSIPGGSYDNTAHQLYFGNPSAGTPPANPSNVWYPYRESDTTYLYFLQEGQGSIAYDSSVNSRNCSIDSTVQWAPSKFGNGLRFNRANYGDSRSLNCGSAIALSSFTIEFWYKPDADDGGRIAGELAGGGNGGGGSNWLLTNFEGRIRFDTWPCGTCGSSEVRSDFNLRNSQYSGKWNHIAVTFNGGNEVKFYINGALDSTKYLSQSGINTFTPPLEIGSAEGIGQVKANMGAFRISSGVKTSFPYGAFANFTNEPTTEVGSIVTPPGSGSPDLVVLNLAGYPNPGGGVLVQALVQNQGGLPTQNGFFTDLYVDHLPIGTEDYAGSIQFWVNEPITTGATITLTTVVTDLVSTGLMNTQSIGAINESTATLYAQADSTGGVGEPDDANNIYAAGTEICLASPDAYESDDTAETAKFISVSQTQTHNIDNPGDRDWVRFNAETGRTYRLQTSNLGLSADTYLYLYDTDRTTLLASNDDYGGNLASQIDWTAPATGTYYVLVQHWNPNAGGCGTAYDLTLSPAATTAVLSLSTDWNLLSIPVSPSSTTITQVLSTITGSYDLVYAYYASDTADPWKKYNTAAPPLLNDLTDIDETKGFWIRTSDAVTLTVSGTTPVSPTIPLVTGWNLVGYPSQVTKPITEALTSCAGKYDLVYAYYASDTADPWKKYNTAAPPFLNDLTEMRPGLGYWVRMTEACNWKPE